MQQDNTEPITTYYNLTEVVNMVERLDEDIRQIGKFYICGFTEQEIAQLLNMSEKSVKRNISKIKKELKKIQIK